MAKNKVEILIKARDEASKKLLRIGKAAAGMGSLLRKAVAAAAFYFGGRAIYRFTKSTVEAAAQQEEAHALLIQSLKNVGAQYQAIFPRLKAFSSEVQQVTKFGDEEVQQLMSLGLNLGLTTDKLEEATRGAIGLRSIMGGKLGLTESMKYLALAYQGEFTMLRRYIPELRKTEDATEQLAIVQQKGAEGFNLAREEALRGLGPLVQMKNAIGDVKEKIGAALLPTVQELALRIKKWAERNQDKIGEWAEISVAAVTLVKDSFIDFLDYMRSDWKNSLSFVLDSFLTLLQTAFETAVTLAIVGGKGIWKGVREGLLGGKQKDITKTALEHFKKQGGTTKTASEVYLEASKAGLTWAGGKRREEWVHGKYFEAGGQYMGHEDWQKYNVNRKWAERNYFETRTKEILGNTISSIGDQWKNAFGEIMASAPEEMGFAWRKNLEIYQAKINEINAKYVASSGTGTFGAGGATGGEPLSGLAAAVSGKLAPLEARLLTFAPGQAAQQDPAVGIERNTREQLRVAKAAQMTLEIIKDYLSPGRGSPFLPSAEALRVANFEG